MGVEFAKEPLTLDKQIDLLRERGMVISDEAKARTYLTNISYYRLSAYWYIFLELPQAAHKFKEGTEFHRVVDTYVFDRKLRMLLFDEIERIEISIKTRLIQEFCETKGKNWYEDPALYTKPYHQQKFLECVDDEIKRTSEVFIKHYRQKYNNGVRPPAWMVFQLVSFGQVSRLMKNLRSCPELKAVADHYGVDAQVLLSWMESLSFVRNTAAHHARLWNRRIPKAPVLPNNPQHAWLKAVPGPGEERKLYAVLAVVRYLLARFIPSTSFSTKLNKLLADHPEVLESYMGFTPNWRDEPLWKN
ncbi:MAG: Abi family protein [Flavobacteriales bacterium]|nr:Abi family protein [Flavobacteriales bacterium]QQS71744.1 MAG: Abi family protein [Flavobacteriales bacterium]HQV38934.1 Abi family protein [Flavobacteriales bacterium]HQW32420.1 Abi family protein [Flavobacteriales bacterium]HQY79918.1 Abi family protein [Flavobacteriales bacterium]